MTYAGGSDVIVPLTGQGKPVILGATLAPAPVEVVRGQISNLAYTLTNPANASVTAQLTLSVLEADGQVAATWAAPTNLTPRGNSTGTQPYTATGVSRTLTAVITQLVGTTSVVLAQAPLRVVEPRLQADPTQLAFTTIHAGESASRTVTVSSMGTMAAGSLTFALSGTGASQYAITQGGCTEAVSLPVSASCTLTVTWRPQAAGDHTAEVRIGYAHGEPLSVSLAGQAKPVVFTGAVQAAPKEVEAGQAVSLNYSLSNPATVPSQMTGTLSVQGVGGQTLDAWGLSVTVGAQTHYAGNQLYTTGAQAQTLTVALSQQVGTTSVVLATDTFTVVDPAVPVGLRSGLAGQARILVLVSCPPGLGAAEDAVCVGQRVQAITSYFNALRLTAKVVKTREDFLAEMRCGTYNTYWVSGGAVKLDDQVVGEVREAVYRGEALWMDGVHDSRNHLLHPVAGVKELGKLPDRNQPLSGAAQGLYGAGSLATLGQVTKFEPTSAAVQAQFTQVPGQQAPVPAIVSNDYGRGKSLLFAFDLAAMLTADTNQANASLRGLVGTSASHAGSGSPTLTLGDMTQLSATIGNEGTRTVAFRTEATLPAGWVSMATNPLAQTTAGTDGSTQATWSFSLAGGASREITWLVRAQQAGSFSVPLSVYSLPAAGSSLAPKLRASASVDLDVQAAQSLLDQVASTVNALAPPAPSDGHHRAKALSAVNEALALHGQGSYEQAITQWIAAADALIGIESADTTAARSAVALALEASTDALCIQRCGNAACQ